MEMQKDRKLISIRDVIDTEESRVNYLKGLIRIAECDNNKTTVEEGYISKIAETFGATYSEIWMAEGQRSDDHSKCINFETKQEKIIFLMQALYLCWLDDDYSESEREEIVTISGELGIDASELAEIESWVKQGIEWMGAGAELLRLE